MRGIDYAWANPKPSPTQLKADGVAFVMRYISADPSKDLTPAERDALLAAGISIGLVWEVDGHMNGGAAAGEAAAVASDAFCIAMGMPGIPVYFACDMDPRGFSGSDWNAIDGYMGAVASVLGLPRTGGYGAHDFIGHCFNAGRMTYGWQTYAWSSGMWDSRAQLRQILNGVTLVGLPNLSADLDENMAADYGQWPRPSGPQPVPPYQPQWTEFDMSKIAVLSIGAADTPGGGFWSVHRLQVLLNMTGDLNGVTAARSSVMGAPDGSFGPKTQAAVRGVQQHYGIAADGIAGAQTWSVLLTGSAS